MIRRWSDIAVDTLGAQMGAFSEIVPQAFHRFPGLLILAATGPRNTAESNTAGYQ